MKKIIRTINLYEYSELEAKAKTKALNHWNEHCGNLMWLQSYLNDQCGGLLREHGIVCTSNHPVCLYSLSHSQGDGLMFEGTFEWKKWSITIKHSGHYEHKYCRDIQMVDTSKDAILFEDSKSFKAFVKIYESICDTLEKLGYDYIESETSEAHFIDQCNANKYLFTKDGTLDSE